MREWIANRYLDRFSARYRYDVSYLRALLESSPAGFFKFAPFSKPPRIAKRRLSLPYSPPSWSAR